MVKEPEALAILREEIARPEYGGMSADEISKKLIERPVIDNPNPREDVRQPLNMDDFPDALLQKVGDGMLGRVIDTVQSQDREQLRFYAKVLLRAEIIGQAAYDAIVAYTTTLVPDPSWKAKVPAARCRLEEIGLAHIEYEDGQQTHLACPTALIERALSDG